MKTRLLVVLIALGALAPFCLGQAVSKPLRKKPVKGQELKTEKADDQALPVPAKVACPVVKDTWIYAFRPDSNYGGGFGWKDLTDPTQDLTVAKMFLGFGGTDKKIILLEFDISKLPKGREAKRAVVRLYNDFAGSSAATAVAAKLVMTKWDEMKVTWRTAPRIDTAATSTTTLKGAINYSQPGVWYEWEVTKLINFWKVSNKPCYGIALDPVGDYGVDRDFVCKEYKAKAQYAPVLAVEYEPVQGKAETKETKTQ